MAGYDKSRIVGLTDEDLDEFLCAICQEVFNNPVVTQCCRQTYCKACIEQWLQTRKTCPNDRTSLELDQLTAAPRFAFNILDKMKIKCDFHENGCQVVTTIGDLSKHLEICEHKPELNCKTQNMTWNMSSVLESARKCVNNFKIESPLVIDSTIKRDHLIAKSKEAILNCDSFQTISRYLSDTVNQSEICKGPKWWHVNSFSDQGGETWVKVTQFFRIRFDKVVIEIFTSIN